MPKNNKKIKVLMALSGGVDSSVSAALLVKAGYSVTAAYMINYDNNEPGSANCWLPDYRDAVRVAAHLNIPILKLDFTKEYKRDVLEYLFKEYELGRTPNPDVLCNTFIKFGSWLEKAQELGFDYLATGHYARVANTPRHRLSAVPPLLIEGTFNESFKKNAGNFNSPLKRGEGTLSRRDLGARGVLAFTNPPYKGGKGVFALMQAKDKNKDQTYFLHQLNQDQLSRVMFPVGNYTKPQVRALAKKFKLPTADKAESMGICFVGEVPMDEFLQKRIKPTPGKIVMTNNTEIGEHQGLAFYTIGQRHLGVASQEALKNVAGAENKAVYVVGKNLKTNELIVGFEDDPAMFKKEIELTNLFWTDGFIERSPDSGEDGQAPKFPLQCLVRLRHRQKLVKAKVQNINEKIVVTFAKPERSVTPGQFAVFYKNGECLGGGVIA